jgi:kinetochore protein Spc7/SPC105
MTLHYKREIELVFDIAQQQTTFLSLQYIADTPAPCPPEKEFFLHHLRAHLSQQANSPTKPNHLLRLVSAAWNKAETVSAHIRRLNFSFTTAVAWTPADGSVSVTSSVLLVPLQTRVEVVLRLGVEDGDGGIEVVVVPEARVVYGEGFNVGKMTEFMVGRVGGAVGGKGGKDGKDGEGGKVGWDEAVLELYRRLLAKGSQRQ